MIVLTVQTFNGQPVAGQSARFDELGGSIGRADTNQLVLVDPERSVSRVHAQVVFRNGGYALVDRGSNPVLVNGQALGNGREVLLREGDTLAVGGYVIRASLAVAGTAAAAAATAAPAFDGNAGDDPFGDPFASQPPPAGGPGPAPTPAWPAASAGSAAHALFGDPFSAPAAPPAPSAWATGAGGGGSAGAAATLPHDWDPFAAPAAPATPSPGTADWNLGAAGGAASASMSAPSRTDSLDKLFDLGFSTSADPFAALASASPLVKPNTESDTDPMRAFGLSSAPVAAALPDHVPDLNTPWQSPALGPPQEAPTGAAPVWPAEPLGAAPPQGAVLSWQQPSRDGKLVTLPGQHRAPANAAPAAAPGSAELGAVAPQPAASAGNLPNPSGQASAGPSPLAPQQAIAPAWAPAAPAWAAATAALAMPTSAHAANTSTDALRQALADGLGMPADRLGALDAAQLRLIGQLLREATGGAVELLVARAALKREMRTDVTMIVAKENNPLKFSPNVDVALQHLLGTPLPGFMPPAKAMRDAFDDLRAHQLGVMAGMRAALEGVLARFEPTQLEGKIAARRSALAALLPSTRKAQLWEQFQQLYAQLSVEATEDFQALFGKAFRQAYEAHIDALQDRGD